MDRLGLVIEPDHVAALWRHFTMVLQANRRVNLTRITEPDHAAARHYADSLAVVAWSGETGCHPRNVLDIGTGAGFPALPVAVCRPDWNITAIDGTLKKVTCVRQFIDELGLGNCRVHHARAESWSEGDRFDLVLLRAVAPLERSVAQAGRLLAASGVVVCYKSARRDPDEERLAARLVSKQRYRELPQWPYELSSGGRLISMRLRCFAAA